MDEVGPLELEGKGLWPALNRVIFLPLRQSLLVIRLNVVNDFLQRVRNKEWKIFDVREDRVFSRLIEEIKTGH